MQGVKGVVRWEQVKKWKEVLRWQQKELVLKAFRGEEVDRVPVGFWYHFAEEDELLRGFNNPEIFAKNVAGHKKFVDDVKPDFVKIMSDGFFAYPNPLIKEGISSIKDLAGIQSTRRSPLVWPTSWAGQASSC